MQIFIVVQIFLLFSDQILGGAKVSERGNCLEGGRPPPVEERHELFVGLLRLSSIQFSIFPCILWFLDTAIQLEIKLPKTKHTEHELIDGDSSTTSR